MRKFFLPLIGAFLLCYANIYGQNAIIGSGFANGWDYNSVDNWVFFSAGVGSTRILTINAKGTGNQFFRIKRGWDSGEYRTTEFRPISGLDTEISSFGTIVSPLTGTNGAFFINVSSTDNYYVFKTPEGGGDNANAKFLVFELPSLPISISSTQRIPNTVYSWQKPVVYATLSGSLPSGQGVYIRYTEDNWTTSTVSEMTLVSGNKYKIELPFKADGSTIKYYVLTSGDNLNISHGDADLFTINLLNNAGANYEYTVQSGTVKFTSSSGNWSQTSTWESGIKPGASDPVVIQHNVTLDENVTINSLLINLASSLTINSNANLTVSSELGNNNQLLIKSDVTGSGSLKHSTADVPATVERYIPKYNTVNDYMFHFLSSPVEAQAIREEFVTNIPTAGHDFYSWDEEINTWINTKAIGGGWNNSFEDNFVVGKGYMVAYPSTVTKTFTGELNTYPPSSPLVKTCTHTTGQGNGWNLLGNPFPSAIDWDLVAKGVGMDNALYYYDAAAQNYRYYIQLGEIGSLGSGSQYIPPMQGFMVHAKSTGTKTISIDNDDRVHSGQNLYYKSTENSVVGLSMRVTNTVFEDEMFIHFTQDATAQFDGSYDAFKLTSYNNQVPKLYTISSDEKKLAINGLPEFLDGIEIPVYFETGLDGQQTITAELSQITSEVFFIDQKIGVTHNLSQNPVYTFTSQEGDSPNRFLLKFSAVGIDDTTIAPAINAWVHDNTLFVNNQISPTLIEVFDLMGRAIYNTRLTCNGLQNHPMKLTAGIYMVRINNGSSVKTIKALIE